MLKRIIKFNKDDRKHLQFLFLNMIKQFFKGDLYESKEAYYWIKIHLSYDSHKLIRAEHELKIWPEYFQAVASGQKNFEVRKNDRDFKVGDILILKEYDPVKKEYTGDYVGREVTYILDKQPFVPEGYVVMSIDIA